MSNFCFTAVTREPAPRGGEPAAPPAAERRAVSDRLVARGKARCNGVHVAHGIGDGLRLAGALGRISLQIADVAALDAAYLTGCRGEACAQRAGSVCGGEVEIPVGDPDGRCGVRCG